MRIAGAVKVEIVFLILLQLRLHSYGDCDID
jgi:hypothetical protein